MKICVKINNSRLQEIKNFAKVCCSISREGSSHKGSHYNSLRYIGAFRGLVAPKRIGIWWYRRCDGRWILCHNVDKFFLAYFFICYFCDQIICYFCHCAKVTKTLVLCLKTLKSSNKSYSALNSGGLFCSIKFRCLSVSLALRCWPV